MVKKNLLIKNMNHFMYKSLDMSNRQWSTIFIKDSSYVNLTSIDWILNITCKHILKKKDNKCKLSPIKKYILKSRFIKKKTKSLNIFFIF